MGDNEGVKYSQEEINLRIFQLTALKNETKIRIRELQKSLKSTHESIKYWEQLDSTQLKIGL